MSDAYNDWYGQIYDENGKFFGLDAPSRPDRQPIGPKCELAIFDRPSGIFFDMNEQHWHIQWKGQCIPETWPRTELGACEQFWRELNEQV